MKTKLAIIAVSVFAATSLVADTGLAEKMPAATIVKTKPVTTLTSEKEEGVKVPFWLVAGLLAWIIVDLSTETSRYRESND